MSVVINGSAGVTTNSGAVYDGIQSATAQASTSGTSIDFTGIPSWVKRITVMFSGVSTNGSSNLLVQIGTSGGVDNTGYLGSCTAATTGVSTVSFTTGFGISVATTAAALLNGTIFLNLMDVSTNKWASSNATGLSSSAQTHYGGGF